MDSRRRGNWVWIGSWRRHHISGWRADDSGCACGAWQRVWKLSDIGRLWRGGEASIKSGDWLPDRVDDWQGSSDNRDCGASDASCNVCEVGWKGSSHFGVRMRDLLGAWWMAPWVTVVAAIIVEWCRFVLIIFLFRLVI